MNAPPKVGDRVAYSDVANPRRVGTVVERRANGTEFRVEWDEPYIDEADQAVVGTISDLRQAGWVLVSDDETHAEKRHAERRRQILGTLEGRATSTLDHRRALELALEIANCSYCRPLDPFESRPLLEKTLRELDVLHEIADGALDPVMRRARSLRANVDRRRNEQSRRDAIRRADELDDIAEKARIFSYARAAILETLAGKPTTGR